MLPCPRTPPASALEEAGEAAHKLVEVLRNQGYEAYEFHDRGSSIVTVGSFDSVGTPRADGKIEIYFDDMKAPIMTATDKTFTWGQVGIGSFDDSGNWKDISLRGNVVKAFIVLRPGFKATDALRCQIQEFAKNQMAGYKQPRKIDFVENLPKTTSGKIKRRELRNAEREG